jgi:hypothetical protein
MPLDYKYVEHERIVQSIWKALTGIIYAALLVPYRYHSKVMYITGDRLACPMYGNHWEEIGFQGTDPATDCRGSGMLGLILVWIYIYHVIALYWSISHCGCTM